MKYFEIVEAPEHKYAPRVKNRYGQIDVRDICIKKYPDLPKRELFVIESSEKTIFTDIILFPFLLPEKWERITQKPHPYHLRLPEIILNWLLLWLLPFSVSVRERLSPR